MKKALMILLAICALGLTGCKKDHYYYIQYKIYFPGSYLYDLSAMITDCDGQQTELYNDNAARAFECLIGPVHTGFKASISLDDTYYAPIIYEKTRVEIYACRDAEPWVLKATGFGTASYTLDF